MNKRQVLIFWVVAIALGAALAIVKFSQKENTQSTTQRAPGQTLLASFPAAEVATVALQGASETVTLTKKDGRWVVAERDNYPANAGYVNDFLRTLNELKVTRAMEAGPSLAPRFGMDETSSNPQERGLTATFKDASGKEVAKVSLGKNIESGNDASPMGMMGGGAVGRYVRNHADESGFYGVSEMFPSVSTEAQRWLADDFISPEKIKSITLSQKGKDEPEWKVTRETEEAEFKLDGATGGETLDSTAASPLKSLFSYARFDDVVTAEKAAELGDAAAKRKAVVETFEGFVYQIQITPAKTSDKPAEGAADAAAAPAPEHYYLTVEVAAELPKERKKEEGEKEEDAKAKEAAFAERLKTLSEKLNKEKALAGRTFKVGKYTVDSLLKERAQLITKATPAATTPPEGTGSTGTPPAGATTPPIDAPPAPPTDVPNSPTTEPKKRIEAVTPPIAIPPIEEQPAKNDDAGKDAGQPDTEKPADAKPAEEK